MRGYNLFTQKMIKSQKFLFENLIESAVSKKEIVNLRTAELVCVLAKENNGKAYIVGGYTRNLMIFKNPAQRTYSDIDIEVYGIKPANFFKILNKFGTTRTVGKNFRTILFKNIDISFPSKVNRNSKDMQIIAEESLSLEESAERRDFTINAISIDPLTGTIYDCCSGLKDISAKLIRCVKNTVFIEDPLRVFRAARLAGQLNFSIEIKTLNLCKEVSLSLIDRERLGLEWKKTLLYSLNPGVTLEYLYEFGVLKELYPEFHILNEIEQNPHFHPEGNVFKHTIVSINKGAELTKNIEDINERLIIMLSILCHDLGKASATRIEGEKITSYGHEIKSLEIAENFLNRIKISKSKIEIVLNLIKEHMFLASVNEDFSDKAVKKLAARLFPSNIRQLVYLLKADCNDNEVRLRQIEKLEVKANNLSLLTEKEKPCILGRDLLKIGFNEGRYLGKFLTYLYNIQLNSKDFDKEEILKNIDLYKKDFNSKNKILD